MRLFIAGFVLLCSALLVATDANFAQETKKEKEIVLKGKITCDKCDLGKSTECATVIVVKDEKSKKDIVYFFDAASHGKFHDDVCSSPKDGSVSGTVKDDGKKKVVSVKKVTYD